MLAPSEPRPRRRSGRQMRGPIVAPTRRIPSVAAGHRRRPQFRR
ncbi:MAG: hypothetical protein AVDCRST_MAG19-3239 [uncultured Thermomicrobiales bacterium]|uniref:Uncharacterized protein n=1 Tax=uncultured Thermomicrobiales bacterium TaxID=1645740 RepID=A0A6J4VBX9_9BACT|nr:MAG: hypothetical protein AVDCRST_MAG19-3239 [uncultured Thermomicrobiales bacterium]